MMLDPTRSLGAFALVLAGVVAGACGSLGGEGGGGANLPNRGIVPYHLVDPLAAASASGEDLESVRAADAFVLRDERGMRFRAPSALVDHLGRVELYVEVVGHSRAWIGRFTSEDGLELGALELVIHPAMLASLGIDTFRVGAPSVVREGSGARIAFAFGDGDGIGWTQIDASGAISNMALALVADDGERVGDPSLIPQGEDGVWSLYFGTERPIVDEIEGEQLFLLPSVGLATAADGEAFERRGLVLTPGTDCVGSGGEAKSCWDRAGVGTPEVRVAVTALGRRILRLWYSGGEPGDRDIGFASSFDGRSWERFPFNPVIDGSLDERDPTNIFFGGRYLLYFVQSSARVAGGVALAANDKPRPSELF